MNILQKFIIAVRFIGLANTLRTLRYSIFRDLVERQYPVHPPSGDELTPGSLQEAEKHPSGARFRFERAALEIHFLDPGLVRISWEPGQAPIPYALVERDWTKIEIRLEQRGSGWSLASDELEIIIDAHGGLDFRQPDGNSLRVDEPPFYVQDIEFESNDDDVEAPSPSDKAQTAWRIRSRQYPEEHVYGLGEQATSINLRGRSYRLWNTDPGGQYGPDTQPIYMPVPVHLNLHSQGSCLTFYENYHPASAQFGVIEESSDEAKIQSSKTEFRFEGGMLRYYFIPGPPAVALERYTQLTGKPPLPPQWSLGYHQCHWGYKNDRHIQEVAEGFEERDLPISVIHMDIDYMDGYRVFTVDRQRFPDLAGLANALSKMGNQNDELRPKGIRLVTIIDPGVKQDLDYPLFREGLQEQTYCLHPDGKPFIGLVWPGWTAFPDFTKPEARAWWGRQYRTLIDEGIAGIWHDMNEPACLTAWGDPTFPLPIQHDMEGRGGDHRQGHNLYGLLMNRAGFEGLRQTAPHRRPWIISRSGWAGLQRYAWSWTGDTASTWGSLRMTVSTVLGMGLSGLPYTGPDIGGFHGKPSAELHTRWFQLAAFLPFFRTHSAVDMPSREPWRFGEPYTSIMRRFLKLRYRLLPYLYSLAWETSQSGQPLVRPLFWEHPGEQRLWGIEDAFLLGSDLLVAPILEEGAVSRKVTLPPGGWLDYFTDEFFQGGTEIELQADLEKIPLLVRDGSLLPMEEDGILELHIYVSEGNSNPGQLRLYNDAGDGYGDWRIDTFTLRVSNNEVRIDWDEEGQFPFPYSSIKMVLHGKQLQQAWLDGEIISTQDNDLKTKPFKQARIELT